MISVVEIIHQSPTPGPVLQRGHLCGWAVQGRLDPWGDNLQPAGERVLEDGGQVLGWVTVYPYPYIQGP